MRVLCFLLVLPLFVRLAGARCNTQLVRLFSKPNPSFSLTGLWNGMVVMSEGNGTSLHQQWLLEFVPVDTKVFTMVNKGTGMVLKHGALDVTCTTTVGVNLEEILWTFTEVIWSNDYVKMNPWKKADFSLDVVSRGPFLGGGIKDGSRVTTLKASAQETQFWKMEVLPQDP